MLEPAFIVGVAGVSGTGKSTVAKHVASRLNGYTVSMERYTLVADGLSMEEREELNYDQPNVIDVELLQQHIVEYSTGHSFESPRYELSRSAERGMLSAAAGERYHGTAAVSEPHPLAMGEYGDASGATIRTA